METIYVYHWAHHVNHFHLKNGNFTILTTTKILQNKLLQENKSYNFNELHLSNSLETFKLGGR